MSWGVENVTITYAGMGGSGPLYNLAGHGWSDEIGDLLSNRFRVVLNGIPDIFVASSPGPGNTSVSGVGGVDYYYYQNNKELIADTNYEWSARLVSNFFGTLSDSLLAFKSHAFVATSETPTSSAITSSSATIACNFIPKTAASTATVWLEYKKTTDPSWTVAGSTGAYSGYSTQNISRNISGLSSSTQYQVRLRMTRDTVNDTSLTSATHSFNTAAGVPTVTTDAASGVGTTVATLNGSIVLNAGVNTNFYFKWGTDNPPTQNQTANQPITDPVVFPTANITGLTQGGVTYYFQAFATFSSPAGSPVSGIVRSFQTQTDPGVVARGQEMLPIQDFDRKYGVATTLFFVVPQDANSSSDQFYTGAVVWAAGEVKITKVTYDDDKTPTVTGPANTTNVPVQVSGNLYRLDLETSETNADELFITLTNGGTSVRDILLRVTTRRQLSQMDIDSVTGAKANTTAFLVRGYGSGHGASFQGGATGKDVDGVLGQHVLHYGTAQTHGVGAEIKLVSTANGNDDFYNGSVILIVGGTGAGQARLIVDYTGSTKVGVVDSAWVVIPANDSEYVVIPGARSWHYYRSELAVGDITTLASGGASMELKMQFMFQRFMFKITQTATVQTLFKADSSTSLGTRSVSDAAGTQTIGKVS